MGHHSAHHGPNLIIKILISFQRKSRQASERDIRYQVIIDNFHYRYQVIIDSLHYQIIYYAYVKLQIYVTKLITSGLYKLLNAR